MPPKRTAITKKKVKESAEVIESTGTGKKAAGKTKTASDSSEMEGKEINIVKSEKRESGKSEAHTGKAAAMAEKSGSGSSAPASSTAKTATVKTECPVNDSISEDNPKLKAAATRGKKNGGTEFDEQPTSKMAPKQVGKLEALAPKAKIGKKDLAVVKVSIARLTTILHFGTLNSTMFFLLILVCDFSQRMENKTQVLMMTS